LEGLDGDLMDAWDRAAQQYFDPPDPEPRCDICDGTQYSDCGCEPGCSCMEWNGETGCHVVCEERAREDAADDGEEMLRQMEQAADEAAAGLPFGGSE
jgi:hypothetical protein